MVGMSAPSGRLFALFERRWMSGELWTDANFNIFDKIPSWSIAAWQ
jgi:hypothetical protein